MENPANLLSYQTTNPFLFEQTNDGVKFLPISNYPTLEINFKDKTFPVLAYTYHPLKIGYGSFAMNLMNDMADCGDEQIEINPYHGFDAPYNLLKEALDDYDKARDFLVVNEDFESFDEITIAYEIEKFISAKEVSDETPYGLEIWQLLKSQLEDGEELDALVARLKKIFNYVATSYYGDELKDTGYGFTLASKKGTKK